MVVKPIKYKKSIRKIGHESLITNRQDDILKSDFLYYRCRCISKCYETFK